MKEKVQSLGRFLSAMIMPNIGAFIAWGLIAALFIETGWLPNEQLAMLNEPMSHYLLPLLIGYTGGKLVDDVRGGVAASIAVMGVIVSNENPQFLGAMIVGPLTGYVMKVFDGAIKGHVKAGFEMLVDNFSVGILGGIMAILSFYFFGPVLNGLTNAMAAGVQFFVDHNILPLASIIVEPAKVLFLNNAINHGIFTPLGLQQVDEVGKSIFFLIEANPGPGLGILIAYCIAGKGQARETAPAAIIIEFFGGIHEIFFPYVLMNPVLIIAQILGGMTGVFIESITGAGLVGPASPGSFLAIMALVPRGGGAIGVILGIFGAAIVSAVVATPLLKIFGKDEDIEAAQAQMADMKSASKGQPVSVSSNPADIKNIVFACDAGMGSSAMGATVLANELASVGRDDITVEHASVSSIPSNAQIVVTHQDLKERAEHSAPQAEIVTITNFMNAPEYKELAQQLSGNAPAPAAPAQQETKKAPADTAKNDEILLVKNIKTNVKPAPKETLIRNAGQMLVDSGYVNPDYIDGMIAREETFETNIGNGIAIPHGTDEAKAAVKKSGISVQTIPETANWGESGPIKIVIGIAGVGNDHLDILARIATKLATEAAVDELMDKSPEEIQTFFTTD